MPGVAHRQFALRALTSLVLGLLTHGSVQAALVAYEGFNYPVGQELAGQNGGTGFSAGWETYATGSALVEAGSLNGAGLTTTGGKVFFNPGASNLTALRPLTTPLTPASGVTYMSFLGDLQSGDRFLGVSLYNGSTEIRIIGKGGVASTPNWGIYGATQSATTVPATTEALIVLRIDWNATTGANETLRLWVYPSSGSLPSSEPAVGTALASLGVDFPQISQIRVGAGATATDVEANGWLDEIRIGTTWNDVVPVPEPSSLMLLGLGTICGIGMLNRLRKK